MQHSLLLVAKGGLVNHFFSEMDIGRVGRPSNPITKVRYPAKKTLHVDMTKMTLHSLCLTTKGGLLNQIIAEMSRLSWHATNLIQSYLILKVR